MAEASAQSHTHCLALGLGADPAAPLLTRRLRSGGRSSGVPPREARQSRWPANGPTEASRCTQPRSSSFAYRRARRRDRRERGRGPGPWRARALTARPCSLTRSFPASEHSMAVKVTPTLCCCLYCIRDVPRAPSAAPRLFPLLSLPGSWPARPGALDCGWRAMRGLDRRKEDARLGEGKEEGS